MLLLAPLLWILSCSSREQLVAGGDDMGNFVQAILLDSTGAPLHGRVQVVSESDTFSLAIFDGGLVRIPARHRSWISLRCDAAQYLLDGPADSGELGRLRLGGSRPLTGWFSRPSSIAIPGLGVASRTGGIFHFALVPPGRIRLVASSDSFQAAIALNLDIATTGSVHRDSLFLPPLALSGTSLVSAFPGDTSACGNGCPVRLWTVSNILARDTTATIDSSKIPDTTTARDTSSTFLRLVPDTTGGVVDSGLVASLFGVVDHGNSVTMQVVLRGTNTVPSLRYSAGSVQVFGKRRVATEAPIHTDSLLACGAILMRSGVAMLQDSILLRVDGGDSAVRLGQATSALDDSCVARAVGELCTARWGTYHRISP